MKLCGQSKEDAAPRFDLGQPAMPASLELTPYGGPQCSVNATRRMLDCAYREIGNFRRAEYELD
jgi:hypothetical protein